MGRQEMKTVNKIFSAALSLGLIMSPIASVGAKDVSKETVSPQRAKVGTGTTAGVTEDDDGLSAGEVVTGIATAALLAIILEIALDGKKDRGTTPPAPGPGPGPTTTTTTATGTGN